MSTVIVTGGASGSDQPSESASGETQQTETISEAIAEGAERAISEAAASERILARLESVTDSTARLVNLVETQGQRLETLAGEVTLVRELVTEVADDDQDDLENTPLVVEEAVVIQVPETPEQATQPQQHGLLHRLLFGRSS